MALRGARCTALAAILALAAPAAAQLGAAPESPPPEGVVIRPVAIDYGALAPVIGWGTGEPGIANVLRVLGRKGRFPVIIRLLGAIPPDPDRKELARAAHDAIAAALAPSGMRPAGV